MPTDSLDLTIPEITFEELLRMEDELDFERRHRPGKKPKLFDLYRNGVKLGEWHIKPKRWNRHDGTFYGFEYKRRF